MRILIAGGGIAAAYLANRIKMLNPETDVQIISEEEHPPYDRIHLCRLVDRSAFVDDISLPIDPSVELVLGQKVVAIDPSAKTVKTPKQEFAYDKLIIATGSIPKAPLDISGIDNAATFRSAGDAYKIADHIAGKNVVLVGVGPIGLELLETLRHMEDPTTITLLSRGTHLYDRTIDPRAVDLMQKVFEEDARVHISFNDAIVKTEIVGSRIKTLVTKKLTIEDPFIVFGIGIAPSVDFARESLKTNKGILVNAFMQSSEPDIYAVGEAAEIEEEKFVAGHVKECTCQGDALLSHLLGTEPEPFEKGTAIDGLKVGSFLLSDVRSLKINDRDPEISSLTLVNTAGDRIDQFLLKENRLLRHIGINTNADPMAVQSMIESQQNVDINQLYEMRLPNPRGRLICSCNGTYENDLVEMIQLNCITDFAELKPLSEAGRVCGRCKQDISDIIAKTPVDPELAEKLRAERKAREEAEKLAKAKARIDKYNRLHPFSQISSDNLEEAIKTLEMSSEFNRWISMVTASMRLPASFEEHVQAGVMQLNKLPVIWLELSDCTGNSEAFIKSAHPRMDDLILQYISLDYHELLMAAAGDESEVALDKVIEEDAGKYLLIVEGAIPMALEGKFLRIGPKGETGLELLQRAAEHAAAIMSVGSCAYDGGVVAAHPNPTGAVGVAEALGRDDIINLPGCPTNPVNIVGTLLHYLMFDEMPELDSKNRPLWAYSQRIHDNCERRGHYDLGEFVQEWGDEGAKQGWCLFEMGCKGPYADLNCSLVRFNDGTNWPVGVGHGCIACGAGKIAFDQYANNRKIEEEHSHEH